MNAPESEALSADAEEFAAEPEATFREDTRTSWLVEFRVGCKAVKLCCNGGKLCCKRGKWLFKWAKFKILRPYLSDLQLISGVYKLFISRNMQATCKHGKNLFGT